MKLHSTYVLCALLMLPLSGCQQHAQTPLDEAIVVALGEHLHRSVEKTMGDIGRTLDQDAKPAGYKLPRMPRHAGTPSVPAAPPDHPGVQEKRRRWHARVAKGVRKIGPAKYAVRRSLIKGLVEKGGPSMWDAAIHPHVKDGKPMGFRLVRVTRQGIFGSVGFQSGDVITHVNGQSVATIDKALQMVTDLQKAPKLTVVLLRLNKPTTLELVFE